MSESQACVFVGGPIQYAVDTTSGKFDPPTRNAIEECITALTSRGIKVLSAHLHENFGEIDVSGMSLEVCTRDFAWMGRCDAFVAVLPLGASGEPIPTAGTSVELGWASAMGKPIVLVCAQTQNYSHLVIGLEAIAPVKRIDIHRPDRGDAVFQAVIGLLQSARTELPT